MLEENRRKVEESQRKEALEQQQKELERYLELETGKDPKAKGRSFTQEEDRGG